MMWSQTGERSLSWSQVTARRLVRQRLDAPSLATQPAEIVSMLCGAHAQVLSAAFWSIGLRSASLTAPEVSDALWAEHSLVKTFGPRGTVHLLAAHDLPLWVGALFRQSLFPTAVIPRRSDSLPGQTEEVVRAIAGALFRGRVNHQSN